MYLGEVTGSELLIRMRERSELKDTPFMLVSSETKWENLNALKQAGVMAILPKPFNVEDMKMALQATADYIDPEEFSGVVFMRKSFEFLLLMTVLLRGNI